MQHAVQTPLFVGEVRKKVRLCCFHCNRPPHSDSLRTHQPPSPSASLQKSPSAVQQSQRFGFEVFATFLAPVLQLLYFSLVCKVDLSRPLFNYQISYFEMDHENPSTSAALDSQRCGEHPGNIPRRWQNILSNSPMLGYLFIWVWLLLLWECISSYIGLNIKNCFLHRFSHSSSIVVIHVWYCWRVQTLLKIIKW